MGWLGIKFKNLVPQSSTSHDGTGAPSKYKLLYSAVDQWYRVFLSLSDGKCGGSAAAMCLNGFDRFESRHAHETAVRDVWQRMIASAVSLALDDHPTRKAWETDLSDDEVAAIGDGAHWTPQHWLLAAKTFHVPINLFRLPEDRTLDDEV